MTLYDKNTFVIEPVKGDKLIYIRDVNANITHEINPWRITVSFNASNSTMITLKTHGTNTIYNLFFGSYNNANDALTILQNAIDKFKLENPYSDVPKSTVDYIDYIIQQLVAISNFTHRQDYPAETWYFEHDLDKIPSITVTDDNGVEIDGLVTVNDDMYVRVDFNEAITGWVFLN